MARKPRKKNYQSLMTALGLDPKRSSGLAALLRRLILGSPENRAGGRLSRREREVLELIGRNYSNIRIAQELGITPETVKKHVQGIRGKLGLASREDIYYWRLKHKD